VPGKKGQGYHAAFLGMAVSTVADQYEKKELSYFEYDRREMLVMIPRHVSRVLDVGCGRTLWTLGEARAWS
jgi:hypothetical protein